MNLSSEHLLVLAKGLKTRTSQEKILLRALQAAIIQYGSMSLETGLALTDLADCYGAQNKHAEEQATREQISRILSGFIKANPQYLNLAERPETV